MLESYLDDSGTHQGSPVVVWGGVAGHKYYLDKLDAAWRERLKNPCDGKPPVKAFHSYDLAHGIGEFEGYSEGARDLTRRNFRQVIVESDVTVVAYGVSVRDWDQIIRVGERRADFTAEQSVFGKALFDLAKCAKDEGEALSLQFDQGRDRPDLRQTILPAIQSAQLDVAFVSYGFLPVDQVPALQAADMVVHESYRAFRHLVDDSNAVPHPHAKRLFEDPFAGTAKWMGRREIKDTVRRMAQARKRAAKKAKKGRPS